MEKISAVYKIVNTVTNDCYVGSSKNVKKRWKDHKYHSTWKQHPNSKLYQDMQKYGVDKFRFQILCPVEPEHLKEVEQELIEMIHPTYNNIRANGCDIGECRRKWRQSNRGKEFHKEYQKKWRQSEKGKDYIQSEKYKESIRKGREKYKNQLCSYNGETITLDVLRKRFRKAGVEHPTLEAKKFLLANNN